MRKRRLKKWVKVLLVGLALIALAQLAYKMARTDRDIYNKCVKDYPQNYCLKLIYGN